MTWTVEFFEDDQGRQPAREWLKSLDSAKRAAAIAAIEVFLTACCRSPLVGHDGERRGLPYPKAELLVEPDRPHVAAHDVQECAF